MGTGSLIGNPGSGNPGKRSFVGLQGEGLYFLFSEVGVDITYLFLLTSDKHTIQQAACISHLAGRYFQFLGASTG